MKNVFPLYEYYSRTPYKDSPLSYAVNLSQPGPQFLLRLNDFVHGWPLHAACWLEFCSG
jgi:hypothetical protein